VQDAEPLDLATADPERRRGDDRFFSVQESGVRQPLARMNERVKFQFDFNIYIFITFLCFFQIKK
jgi:hypothetical protein